MARIETVWSAPFEHPNGLAASAEGLWVVEQWAWGEHTEHVALVDWETGKELHRVATQSVNSSGLAFDGTHLWVARNAREKPATILKVNKDTGATLASFPVPNAPDSGVHGLEWVDGTVWVTSLGIRQLVQVRDEDWSVIHSIPFDHSRAHGLAWDNGLIWCVDTNDRAIYKLDAKDGREVEVIPIPKPNPEPHGLAIRDGVLWYCDAESGAVCRIVME
jgi:streptogramin lyase